MPESEDQKEVCKNDLRNAQFGGGFINAENVNAQRIGGDIWNFLFGQQLAPVGNPARQKNERLLLAEVKQEVTSRLKQSLDNTVLINLGKELEPEQVNRPWDAEIKIGSKHPEPLPDTTTILEIFDSEEIAGRLLILGMPGSGKTTTLLELAQSLIQRAEEQPDYPIPVLFNLSSWKDDKQSITEWLVVELQSKYSVSSDFSKKLLEEHQLLPMLDGLDELKPVRQELCVRKINEFFLSEYRPIHLVICSRSEEYNIYQAQLFLRGAICLQPLSYLQIRKDLLSLNRTDLWSAIRINNDELLALVNRPLFLSFAVLAEQELSIPIWRKQTSMERRIQYLIYAYTRRMLTREINKNNSYSERKPPTSRQTEFWLNWLAQQMESMSESEFLIETIQPFWLKNKLQKKILKLAVKLIIAFMFILIPCVLLGIYFFQVSALIYGLFFGLIFSSFVFPFIKIPEYIQTVESLIWSCEIAKQGKTLEIGFYLGLIFVIAKM